MEFSRRHFLKYSLGVTGALLLPSPLTAAPSLLCPTTTHLQPLRRQYSPKELAKLTVSLHPYEGKPKAFHMRKVGMIAEGLRKHGLYPTYEKANAPIDSDVAIGMSFRHKKMHLYRQNKGLNTLFLEAGFFQPRTNWVSVGWEGINNCANFELPQGYDSSRWEKHFLHHLRPWQKNQDGHILLMGQKHGDAALYGLKMNRWLEYTANRLATYNKRIIFRPHPHKRAEYTKKNKPWRLPSGTILSQHKNLHKDLAGAAFSVTYSSTAAVESVLAGISCVTAHKGSIAHPVTSHDITNPYFYPDRTSWCIETAWKQWSYEELRNGDAWDVAKQHLLA